MLKNEKTKTKTKEKGFQKKKKSKTKSLPTKSKYSATQFSESGPPRQITLKCLPVM